MLATALRQQQSCSAEMSAYSEDDASMHSNLSEGGAELGQLRKHVPESEEYDTITTLFEEPQARRVPRGRPGYQAGAVYLFYAGNQFSTGVQQRQSCLTALECTSIEASSQSCCRMSARACGWRWELLLGHLS